MDKQKQIEEMARDICSPCHKGKLGMCEPNEGCVVWEYAKNAVEECYRKIPEWAVFLTSEEYQRYERIEKIIKLSKMEKANGYEVKNGKLYYFSNMLGGCEIEFKDLQEICDMANYYNEGFWDLDQQLTFWKSKAEETRKETAEKFAERLKSEMQERDYMGVKYKQGVFTDSDIDEILKELQEC